MELFEEVFDKAAMYDMLFFSVKSVLEYPTINILEDTNPIMYERWKEIAKSKYSDPWVNKDNSQLIYESKAVNYPEFCKIVSICYATVYHEEGKPKRLIKQIVNEDESIVIETFIEILSELSSNALKSSPKKFMTFCGHNIISNDIPLLMKRFIANRDKFKIYKTIPFMLKRLLSLKPWDGGIVDIMNVWKFNGFMNDTLMLPVDFIGLKSKTPLMSKTELNQYYWNWIETKPEETLKTVSYEAANQTNLAIQFIKYMREL